MAAAFAYEPRHDGCKQDVAAVHGSAGAAWVAARLADRAPRSAPPLAGRVVVVTGGTRGIGLAVACAAAAAGARVAILGKTVEPHPRLPGTLATARAAVEAAAAAATSGGSGSGGGSGVCLALRCDVRSDADIAAAVAAIAEWSGGGATTPGAAPPIDVLINNASAISLTPTDATAPKAYDLMHAVNGRATFMTTRACLPHLRASAAAGRHPHVLTMSPPLEMAAEWFAPHLAYTAAKFAMSVATLGHAAELAADGIGVNSLWPRTAVATAAVANLLGGGEVVRRSRTPAVVADAAIAIISTDPRRCTGNFFIDEAVLRGACGADDAAMARYAVDPTVLVPRTGPGSDDGLTADFFVPPALLAKL